MVPEPVIPCDTWGEAGESSSRSLLVHRCDPRNTSPALQGLEMIYGVVILTSGCAIGPCIGGWDWGFERCLHEDGPRKGLGR